MLFFFGGGGDRELIRGLVSMNGKKKVIFHDIGKTKRPKDIFLGQQARATRGGKEYYFP